MAIVCIIALLVLLSGLDGGAWPSPRSGGGLFSRPRSRTWRMAGRPQTTEGPARWWWE